MGMFIFGLLLLTAGVVAIIVVKQARMIGIGLVLGAVVLFGVSSVRTVEPGEVAVPVAFGTAGDPLQAGVQVVAPWTNLVPLSVRTAEYTMTVTANEGAVKGDDSIEVKGKDGAVGRVDATLLFRVEPAQATRLYRETGTDYTAKVVRTNARTCVRDGFTEFNMIEAATTARAQVQTTITECLRNSLEPRGLAIESFQLRGVRVDDNVQKAIDAKVAAQQQAEQKQFELQAARQDAERKRIEAQAVSDSQQIVKCGATSKVNDQGQTVVTALSGTECQNQLTPEYLQWFYVETLSKLVNAPNNTVIILPFDQGLTPMLNVNTNGNGNGNNTTVSPPTTVNR